MVFWVIVVLAKLLFRTRDALNRSLAWTEEVAINALIVLVFAGAAISAHTTRHIHVDLLYHQINPALGIWLSRLVDLIKLGLFLYATWLIWRYLQIVVHEKLISVELSRARLLYPVIAAFLCMSLRASQVLIPN